jgi:hypothetical protein
LGPEVWVSDFFQGGEIANTVEFSVYADPLYSNPEVKGYLVRSKHIERLPGEVGVLSKTRCCFNPGIIIQLGSPLL